MYVYWKGIHQSIDINEGFQWFGNTFQNKVIHSAISPPAMEGIWVFWSLRILEKSTCEVGDKLQICGLFVSVRIHLRVEYQYGKVDWFYVAYRLPKAESSIKILFEAYLEVTAFHQTIGQMKAWLAIPNF